MTYRAKPSSIEETISAQQKCKKKAIWCVVYSLMIISLYCFGGFLPFLEEAIELNSVPNLSDGKREAVNLVFIVTAICAIMVLLYMWRLFVRVRGYKAHTRYLGLLQMSRLEISNDTISGTNYATENSDPEEFSIPISALTNVTFNHSKLNLVFYVGEQKYQCLEIDRAKEIHFMFKEEIEKGAS